MAHFKKAFPSRYLQVSDLDDPVVATIKTVKVQSVGSGDDADDKLVVTFAESDLKPCVLNLTRAEAIAAVVGSGDTDDWPGTRVQLAQGTTSFKGRSVSCITISAPPKPARTAGKHKPDDIDIAMASSTEPVF
jgi:hypothetical protein